MNPTWEKMRERWMLRGCPFRRVAASMRGSKRPPPRTARAPTRAGNRSPPPPPCTVRAPTLCSSCSRRTRAVSTPCRCCGSPRRTEYVDSIPGGREMGRAPRDAFRHRIVSPRRGIPTVSRCSTSPVVSLTTGPQQGISSHQGKVSSHMGISLHQRVNSHQGGSSHPGGSSHLGARPCRAIDLHIWLFNVPIGAVTTTDE